VRGCEADEWMTCTGLPILELCKFVAEKRTRSEGSSTFLAYPGEGEQ